MKKIKTRTIIAKAECGLGWQTLWLCCDCREVVSPGTSWACLLSPSHSQGLKRYYFLAHCTDSKTKVVDVTLDSEPAYSK